MRYIDITYIYIYMYTLLPGRVSSLAATYKIFVYIYIVVCFSRLVVEYGHAHTHMLRDRLDIYSNLASRT